MKNPLKNLFFWRNYTTKQHYNWWKRRKMNWEAEMATMGHPHRKVICQYLNMFDWNNLMEIGMGGGANLALIAHLFKGKRLVGTEVNKDAIEFVKTKFKGLETRECPAWDLFMSDKGAEVALTDMCLIYIGPGKIKKVLKEIKRTTKRYVILCEFHHKNWFKRQWLRIRQGYHSYNYKKLLEGLDFYDVSIVKLTKEQWPDAKRNHEFRHLIIAKVT